MAVEGQGGAGQGAAYAGDGEALSDVDHMMLPRLPQPCQLLRSQGRGGCMLRLAAGGQIQRPQLLLRC
eukprot:COSAG01_NODE_1462_length_10236_cov_43.611226_4_plen_68_part_00